MSRKRKIRVAEPTITEENDENTPSAGVIKQKNELLNGKDARAIGDVVLEAQKNASLHEKCIKQMHKLYKQVPHERFIKVMLNYVQFALTKPVDNIATNCILDFCAKLFVSFEQDNNEDVTHPVVCDVFNWLLDTTSSNSYVRFRMCQFINTFFNAFGDEAQMDNAIWDNIQKIMIDRLRDIDMNVRQQAVLALQRLQDPGDPEDKVIKSYIFHVETDPSSKVRRAVLASIAKNQRTIPFVIGRLWDVDENVRRLAYLQLAKYPVTNFKVIQRIEILDQGLTDQSNLVKKCVAQILLPNWIQVYDGNYLQFISALKIDACELDLERFKNIAVSALQEVFRQKQPDDFISALNLSRQEETKKCIKLESVGTGVELLILWQAVIKYLIATDVEDVDTVLPDMSVIAEFLKTFVDENYQAVEQSRNKLEQMYFQFEILLLLEIINGYDFDDEIGRQALQTILLDILQKVSLEESCIKVINEILEKLISDPEKRLEMLVNVIRTITEQNMTFNFEETNKIVDEHLKTSPNVSLMTILSEIKLEVLELIEKRDMAKERNNHADALKYQTEMENKQEEYKMQIKPILESSKDPNVIALADSLYNRRRLSPETISKCLNICFYMVALKSVKHLTPSVCDLYRKFVCNYLESMEIGYRRLALRVATSYSMLYETLASDVYQILGKQLISTSSVAIMKIAIQGIFELLDFYGFEKFQLVTSINRTKKSGRTLYNSNADDTEDEETIGQMDLINSLLSVLDKCLDDQIMLATVMGFCRLILHKYITSADIVAKLLIKYFNPATYTDVMQILGEFFKELISRRQQELLQQALFPTLKQIIDAPAESPLQDVETTKLIQFVINSTRPEFSPPGLNIHNTIAMHFFNINKDQSDSETNFELIKLLAGELHKLQISDGCLREDFKETVDEFLKDIKDSKIVKNLIKFKEMLNDKMKSTVNSTASSQAPSTITDDRSDEEDSVSVDTCNTNNTNDVVFKVPQAKQKPDDTFVPSPIPPTNDVIGDMTINKTIETESETPEDTLPELLAPSTQEQESFFVTSTQIEKAPSSETNVTTENEESNISNVPSTEPSKPETPKKVTKRVEEQILRTRKNKREHPPNSPSVASPARKMEKRAPASPAVSLDTSQGRLTRNASKTAPVAAPILTKSKSAQKVPQKPVAAKVTRANKSLGRETTQESEAAPIKATRSKKNLDKELSQTPITPIKSTRSQRNVKETKEDVEEPTKTMSKRVVKPTEKAKALVETTKRKSGSKSVSPKAPPTIVVESPQRLTRTFVATTPKTPKTPLLSSTRKTPGGRNETTTEEIIPETPPSNSRTRSAKKNVDSPDVIPGSPIGLIGLRSLTRKNLRSRIPPKK